MEDLKHLGTMQMTTERFILRKFNISDAHDVYVNWSSDKDSVKYNAWRIHSSLEVTEDYLSYWIDNYKRDDYYNWAIVNKDNGEVIGSISVSNIKKRKRYCEVGYTIAKKMWNLGIATEVLIRLIKYLTEEVGFETVCAMHDIRNEASGKVMKKAGMKFIKNRTMAFLNSHNLIMRCSIYEYRKN